MPQQNGALLQIEHVTKAFRGLLALNDVSLAVQEGQIKGLIGPNGAGKT
ncbi:MAG: ATP-binding cassette domain-containing protein, partial [Chloroflexi bacterium]|nr:ATP-binding cassette domain-containing protein [Chloroflexota bacterium]